jgi:hypothetical protein
MGWDLEGRGGYCRVQWGDWTPCLETAQLFGWKPAGTLLPYGPPEARGDPGPDWEWSGTYLSNDWQEVTNADAKAFAAALDRAVAAREKESEEREKARRVRTVTVQGNVIGLDRDDRRDEHEHEYEYEFYTDLFKRVADFARHGRFLIK